MLTGGTHVRHTEWYRFENIWLWLGSCSYWSGKWRVRLFHLLMMTWEKANKIVQSAHNNHKTLHVNRI